MSHKRPREILEYSRPRPIPTEWWSIAENFKHQAGKTAAAKRPCEKSGDEAPVAKAPRFDSGIGIVRLSSFFEGFRHGGKPTRVLTKKARAVGFSFHFRTKITRSDCLV